MHYSTPAPMHHQKQASPVTTTSYSLKYTTPKYAAKSPVPSEAYAAPQPQDVDAKVFSMSDLQDLMKYYTAQESYL